MRSHLFPRFLYGRTPPLPRYGHFVVHSIAYNLARSSLSLVFNIFHSARVCYGAARHNRAASVERSSTARTQSRTMAVFWQVCSVVVLLWVLSFLNPPLPLSLQEWGLRVSVWRPFVRNAFHNWRDAGRALPTHHESSREVVATEFLLTKKGRNCIQREPSKRLHVLSTARNFIYKLCVYLQSQATFWNTWLFSFVSYLFERAFLPHRFK